MRSTIFAIVALSLMPLAGHTACYGSDNFQTCSDYNGNTYSIRRYGNTTQMDGYSIDGGSWSQTSRTNGNTTQHQGFSSDGGSWNMTQRQLGGGRQSYDGLNSDGQYFTYTCDAYGNCY